MTTQCLQPGRAETFVQLWHLVGSHLNWVGVRHWGRLVNALSTDLARCIDGASKTLVQARINYSINLVTNGYKELKETTVTGKLRMICFNYPPKTTIWSERRSLTA